MTERHETSAEYLTKQEAARLLRVSERTLDRWSAAGRLARIKLPTGGVRYARVDVRRLLKSDAA